MYKMQLGPLFDDPETARRELIAGCKWADTAIPKRGSSFFIHLSELCPVGCAHCMYASDMVQKSSKPSLDPTELDRAIGFINESGSDKLNITGGGEPFLKLPSILELLARVDTPRIEIVTAGYWAKSRKAADKMLSRLGSAIARNPNQPEVMLRLSLDRYHLFAPQPVPIDYYSNVAEEWDQDPRGMQLGYRSIQPDRDYVDMMLVDKIGAGLADVNEWNRVIRTRNGRNIPMTYNVFRVSGKAQELAEGAELSRHGKSIREYYGPFETGEAKLSLATAVNDAIRGSYTPTPGVAVTLNSDGRFWIFCGTSPDRQLVLGAETFQEAVATFFEDPITRLLVNDGIWALSDLVLELAPDVHQAALAKNDVASLVDDLLCTPEIRLAVTLLATRTYIEDETLQVDSAIGDALAVTEDMLADSCAAAIQAGHR